VGAVYGPGVPRARGCPCGMRSKPRYMRKTACWNSRSSSCDPTLRAVCRWRGERMVSWVLVCVSSWSASRRARRARDASTRYRRARL
jgi:hypothetical protein